MTFRIYHRRFDAYRNPANRKGEMSTRAGAATWDDRAEAEAVAAALNERDRDPNTGTAAKTTGSWSTTPEAPRVVRPR